MRPASSGSRAHQQALRLLIMLLFFLLRMLAYFLFLHFILVFFAAFVSHCYAPFHMTFVISP
jgi:hypothetical protein